MEINILKDFVQSGNINFLIGSGLSYPYLPTLGNIEGQLSGVTFSDMSLDESGNNSAKVAAASLLLPVTRGSSDAYFQDAPLYLGVRIATLFYVFCQEFTVRISSH